MPFRRRESGIEYTPEAYRRKKNRKPLCNLVTPLVTYCRNMATITSSVSGFP